MARAGGNPYHDEEGKFASGPGGGKADPAKRAKRLARRKRKRAALRKRREAIRKEYKARAKSLKADYRAAKRDAVREYRKDVARIDRESRKELASTVRKARKDIAAAKTAGERNEVRQYAKGDVERIKIEHAEARKGARHDYRGQRETDKAYHKEEMDSLRDELKSDADELRDEYGLKLKKRSAPDAVGRSIGKGRIHKASSAESILAHCLRSRGWTRQYWRGELSGPEHLELAHDIRRYGRAWLRHEAEAFVRVYLGVPRGGLDSHLRGFGPGDESEIHRGIASDLSANFGRFFRRAKNFVRELIVGATMALTGPAPLTGEELEGLEREATKQDAFFDQLYDEIKFWGGPSPKAIKLPTPQGIPEPSKPGTPEPPVPIAFPPKPVETVRPTMTPPQFVARVERYADSSHQAAQRANRRAAVQNPMYKAERLVMGEPKTEHCSECPRDAAMGWVPLGTLRPIGERECRQLCLCHFQYSDGDGKTYVQGNRGPLPAPNPSGVRIEPESDGVELVAEPPGVKIDAPIARPPK